MSEYKNLKGLLGKDGKTYVRDTSGSKGRVGKRRYKEERLPYLGAAIGNYPKERLTTRDLQQAQQRAAYIKAQEEAMKQNRDRMTQRDIETFQNDRTRPLPKEAYEQVDQELTYPDEVEGKKSGGMIKCKGGRKAIGGTKFTGVK
jgi:type II secretory pathway pseudopilin PulG